MWSYVVIMLVLCLLMVVACKSDEHSSIGWKAYNERFERFEPFKRTLKYFSCDKPIFAKVEEKVINDMGLLKAQGERDWNIYFPCGYTMAAEELKQNNQFKHVGEGWVMMVDGMDKFAAKDALAKAIHAKYGKLRSLIYIPRTWVLYEEEDVRDLQKYAQDPKNAGKQYILKKNIQRQEGLKIVNSFDEGLREVAKAKEGTDYPFVVVQEVVGNPYKIDGRKINVRCYVLFVCHGGQTTAYLHDDGFVYYSKVPYTIGKSPDEIITSGYIERDVYKKNPLTLSDLVAHFDRVHGNGTADKFKRNLVYVLKGVLDAYETNMCEPKDNNVKYCQMFGIDFQPDATLNSVLFLESNKNASMTYMDERDGALKTKVIADMYATIGVKDSVSAEINNGFKEVWKTSTVPKKFTEEEWFML